MTRKRNPRNLGLAVLPLLAASGILSGAYGEEKIGFNRDIRPILSDKCFHCHGPDSKKREADLRLDVREAAVEAGAIEAGKPEDSEMLARILSSKPKEHMPPAKSKLGDLEPKEVELIKRWIAQGAPYEPHWSFIPVKAPSAASIDELVAKRLQERGLKPQPEADRNTLIRRVSFDLTGLPPTPAEVEAFVKDSDPKAYERLVDRLLASPRYGERMAVDWLDVARYADSYGFQVDRASTVWPWRDWVVKAFNQNLPFDQFITWQVAGDLLPNATQEQVLATAFNRLHQQESEGGSIEEEYRVEYVCDRVQTFATAFLGLTFECVRCHDHKFDPISQKEYYQIFAFFQNIDEAGLYSFFTPSIPTPTLALSDDAGRAQAAKLEDKVVAAQKALASVDSDKDFKAWTAGPRSLDIKGEIARFNFEKLEKNRLANEVDAKQPATLKGENKLVVGKVGNAVEFTGDDAVELPVGNFERHQPFSVSLWVKTPDVKDRAVVFHRSKAWTDAGSRGYELLIEEGKLKWSLIHFWPGNAISIRAKEPLATNRWTHVVVSSDGSSRAGGLRLYVDGKPVTIEVVRDALTKNITGGGGDNISLGERFRDRGFKGGAVDEFRVFKRQLSALEAMAMSQEGAAKALLAKDPSTWSVSEQEVAREFYLRAFDKGFAERLAALESARAEAFKVADNVREIMAMRELAVPKKAYVLFRGAYDQHREEVGMGTPAVLSPWPNGAPKNRLGLAQWLTRPEHPLTARVLVNRFWQGIWGRGLVKTSEDFGSQGARPMYPEVLDWLAWNFVQSGWDTKALMRTIVTSSTYRQRSVADGQSGAQLMADDPENELLARGPRFRLSAEMIRDNALALSGLLSEKIGGAPVNPYEMSEAFKPERPSGGDGLYRRSVYMNWRRTAPPPAMVAFDAPRRSVCAAKRDRTDSPLQALILLNGTQYVEAARVLGQTLHQEHKGDVEAMVKGAFLKCISREPDAAEQKIAQQLYREQLAYFEAKPGEAAALLKTGSYPLAKNISNAQAAAATVLAQALMNHDCCVVKR